MRESAFGCDESADPLQLREFLLGPPTEVLDVFGVAPRGADPDHALKAREGGRFVSKSSGAEANARADIRVGAAGEIVGYLELCHRLCRLLQIVEYPAVVAIGHLILAIFRNSS